MAQSTTSEHREKDMDLLDPDLYAQRVPLEEFARLRTVAPVSWFPTPYSQAFRDEGYWVVTRHADVLDVSRRGDVFSSAENGAIAQFPLDFERERIEVQRLVMLNQDGEQHAKTRRIVARGFTPKAINGLRDALAARAERIVADAVRNDSGDSGDFVADVAVELPLQAIAELIGIPQEDRHKIFTWSNQMIGSDDPDYANADVDQASAEMLGYAWGMAEQRKACPMDDIATKLLNAEIDGSALDENEFSFFVLLLAVAGNETTRNAITHGMNAFFDHPDQWELYKETRARTAPDEIVRWATPIIAFQRTAMSDTQVGGVDIATGQRVVMFYSSANQDPEVFPEPEKFDIMRSPNPHLGFGGTGAHYCLGANLARMEIDLIFNAVADVMPDIRRAAGPRRLRSGWVNGIKELRVAYR
jgi:cholest-4-en-3-one 26-monooxygenase